MCWIYWEKALEEYDEVVHIPMSSGLSSSCATAQMLAQDMDGKVYVVDNQRISVTMRQSVLDAIALAEKGMNAKEIHDILMREKLEASIYITVDTLKYLKKRWSRNTRSSSYRFSPESETGSYDSGRKAGFFF